MAAFREAGYRSSAVPVLRYAYGVGEELRARLAEPDAYAGLIATSPRAVTALERAEAWPEAWTEAPFFVAGPETARRARNLGFAPVGEKAGGARELADRIVRAVRGSRTTDRPLLFLAGNRRRPELPDRLRASGISYEEVTVYRSELRRSIEWPAGEIGWILFFSPSGREAVEASGGLPGRGARIGAIGPTTAEALRRASLPVDAVADHPEPAALVRAVRRAEPSGRQA